MSPEIRVRFAPSPTGYLHVGGARTALFNYLFAKHTGGRFLLRIEDTDRSRFQAEALTEIYESLKWLGLNWDEGPTNGGPTGPYIQSERIDLYKSCSDELLRNGHAYRCFCTSERLTKIREEQEKAKVAHVTGYDRFCRSITAEESDKRANAGEPFVVRFKIPEHQTITFIDMIRGEISYKSDELDDLVLLKTDGFPTYHLANVVDDHHMKISHVLRGDEWIASTPRHVLLYRAFGWDLPHFAHLPVILSPDGGKLSKRKGAASVMDYKRAGYLPQALFNFLALLGWAPGHDKEKMTLEEMVELFSIEKVSAKSAVLDEKKLEWMNGLYLQECSVQSIAINIVDGWKAKGLVPVQTSEHDAYAVKVISLMKDRSKRLTDIIDMCDYFFRDPVTYEEKAAKKNFTPASKELLSLCIRKLEPVADFNQTALDALYHSLAEENGGQVGAFIHPTRLAVSGVSFGPGLFELMELLGKNTVLRRIKKAVENIR